jgi:hypothetical protein
MIMICAMIRWEDLRVKDEDILFDDDGAMAAGISIDNDAIPEAVVDINNSQRNLTRRRLAATLTYIVIAFQSVFDGLVLKYNPNVQEAAVQVSPFFSLTRHTLMPPVRYPCSSSKRPWKPL